MFDWISLLILLKNSSLQRLKQTYFSSGEAGAASNLGMPDFPMSKKKQTRAKRMKASGWVPGECNGRTGFSIHLPIAGRGRRDKRGRSTKSSI